MTDIIEMDERHGGHYQFVRRDELVVHYSVIRRPLLSLLSSGVIVLILGLILAGAVLGWQRFEYHSIATDRAITERVIAFHDATIHMTLQLRMIDDPMYEDLTRDALADMINKASRLRKINPEHGMAINEYQQSLSEVFVYLYTKRGDLDQIMIDFIIARERVLSSFTDVWKIGF